MSICKSRIWLNINKTNYPHMCVLLVRPVFRIGYTAQLTALFCITITNVTAIAHLSINQYTQMYNKEFISQSIYINAIYVYYDDLIV